jgi:exodeoxyribonuclease VII large subunit
MGYKFNMMTKNRNQGKKQMLPNEENQGPVVFTVSGLTEAIKNALEKRFEFVWVEGEISNFRKPVSGHRYMVIKDEKAQIRAVMFRLQARYLKFTPEDGMKVLVQGRLGVYESRGEYQIVLDYMEPVGVGAMAMAFEQVKRKLSAQGIFDREIKKPLPFLPKRIAVITSPTGAAVRDFLKVIHRRFANMEIVIVPVRVQGEQACGDMVEALDLVNRHLKVDVIVLTRGGGSLEDLWAFNQEELAYAIRRSSIPVVSAVGHEIDWSISDLAADLRAATPSVAAEILVQEKESLQSSLDTLHARLKSAMYSKMGMLRDRLHSLEKRMKSPRKRIQDDLLRVDDLHSRLMRLMRQSIRLKNQGLVAETRALCLHSPIMKAASTRQMLVFLQVSLSRAIHRRLADLETGRAFLEKRINDLSPLAILDRGYSITSKLPEKTLLKEAECVRKGDAVHVLLAKGELTCVVEETGKQET